MIERFVLNALPPRPWKNGGGSTREIAAVPPGAEGLVMLPYFAGERTPLFDPDARGLVLGLTLRHGRGHLYRAALEGTAFGVRHNLAAMTAAGGDVRRLVAVGGGARELWTRVVDTSLGGGEKEAWKKSRGGKKALGKNALKKKKLWG